MGNRSDGKVGGLTHLHFHQIQSSQPQLHLHLPAPIPIQKSKIINNVLCPNTPVRPRARQQPSRSKRQVYTRVVASVFSIGGSTQGCH